MRTRIKIEPSREKPSLHKIRVDVSHPGAKEVCIAGTFNDWQPARNPLKPVDDDWWMVELVLPSGVYEYRYVVDGKWTCDPRAPTQVMNPYGSYNSVLIIPPPTRPQSRISLRMKL